MSVSGSGVSDNSADALLRSTPKEQTMKGPVVFEDNITIPPGTLYLGRAGASISSGSHVLNFDSADGHSQFFPSVEYTDAGSTPASTWSLDAAQQFSIANVQDTDLSDPQNLTVVATSNVYNVASSLVPVEVGILRIQSWQGTDDTGAVLADTEFTITPEMVGVVTEFTPDNKTMNLNGTTQHIRYSGVRLRGGLQTSGIFNGQITIYLDSKIHFATEHNLVTSTASFTTGSIIFSGATGEIDQNNANFFWDDVNNRLGLGTNTPISSLQILSDSRQAFFDTYTTNSNVGAGIDFRKSESATFGSHASVTNGGLLHHFNFSGSDGTAFRKAAAISVFVDGVPATNNMPGRIEFKTTETGSTPVTRMVIKSDGKVGIGTTNPSSAMDIVNDAVIGVSITYGGNGTPAADIDLRKSRNPSSSPAAVINGTILGNINFRGYDGNTYDLAAMITGYCDGTPGINNDMPGRLEFKTSSDGTNIPITRMIIKSDGRVGIGKDFVNSGNGALTVKNKSGDPTTRLYLNSPDDTRVFEIGVHNSGTTFLWGQNADSLILGTNATNRFEIKSGGEIVTTGQQQAASGTIVAPSYSFSGDIDTGVYNFVADGMAFVLGGISQHQMFGNQFRSTITSGYSFNNIASSSTSPSIVPQRSSSTTGFGAGAANELSFINSGAESVNISATGNVKNNNFTKLGSSAPAIKQKDLIGTTGAAEGDQVTIAHGLTQSKILTYAVLVDNGSTLFQPEDTKVAGNQFHVRAGSANIIVQNHSTNSENILSKSITVLITYRE